MHGKIYSNSKTVTIIPPIGEGAFIYNRPRREKGLDIKDGIRRLVKRMLDELAEEAKTTDNGKLLTVSPVWWVKHPFTVSIRSDVTPGEYTYDVYKTEE